MGLTRQLQPLKSLRPTAEPSHRGRPLLLSCSQASSPRPVGLAGGQDGPGRLKQRIAEHIQLGSSTGSLRPG